MITGSLSAKFSGASYTFINDQLKIMNVSLSYLKNAGDNISFKT